MKTPSTVCSANGQLVHLLPQGAAYTACGYRIGDAYRVHGKVTCKKCRSKRPKVAARFDDRPLVVGVNHAPFYAAVQRALDAGATEAPNVPVTHWPVLGS